MSDIHLHRSGPPETRIDPPPPDATAALDAALALEDPAARRSAVAAVVADRPRFLAAWAELGDLSRDLTEAYACYRVGYHRGLDTLRASGWRGSGFVRWDHEPNRGFLRALAGLGRIAAAIGEHDEAERCEVFCRQLDPSWPPADLDAPPLPPAAT